MSGYPIHPAKVQRPALRDETLARDRLLDWLHVKVHHRVVNVIAEAGYGKTTLLADFSRRTRLRTLWYRLDAEDRSWVAFLNYLVASGQEQEAGFAPATAALLRDLGSGGASLDAVLDSLIREMQHLGELGAVVLLDDYHAVDESPDVRHIMRGLLQRAPERVSFVFASRRPPNLPVARLRALGEVADLQTDDLRFNQDETEQLFRDTFGRPLEPDVLTDLSHRTEGWAASLQLVHSAIQTRTAVEIRTFVRSLSGAEGDLYDYLAEEVIGTLPEDLQHFLMRVSVLEELDPSQIETATGLGPTDVARLAQEGERSGLLVRGSDPPSYRSIHPLVRQFLVHRLEREVGAEGVRALHLAIARAHYDRWTVACHHFARADEPAELHRCLESAVRSILGAGPLKVAATYLEAFPPREWSAPLAMIQSRVEYQSDRRVAAVEWAERAFHSETTPLSAANLIAVHTLTGDLTKAAEVLEAATDSITDPMLLDIASATAQILEAAIDGRLTPLVENLERMAQRQREVGMTHYEGISSLNAAMSLRAQGEADRALGASTRALEALTESGASHERISAATMRAWSLAHGRYRDELRIAYEAASAELFSRPQADVLTELAAIDIWYGDEARASDAVALAAQTTNGNPDFEQSVSLVRAELALRRYRLDDADQALAAMRLGALSTESAHLAHQLSVIAHLRVRQGHSSAGDDIRRALELAQRQQAWFWVRYCEVLRAFHAPRAGARIPVAVARDPIYLSVLAELVVDGLGSLDPDGMAIVAEEAGRLPERWRPALRRAVSSAGGAVRLRAAAILDDVGESVDVPLLRAVAKSARAGSEYRDLGRRLARNLAPRVLVEDQGRVGLVIGTRREEGSAVRRKVLALLCFLLTRIDFAAARDEVLEALWPDLEPEIAANSLNQTVYFLRRVIEPDYAETTSAGFVRLDSNVVWLDTELVRSRAAECWQLIRDIGDHVDFTRAEQLSTTYRGRFAMDFAYEDWAIRYRDALHAAYLHVMETAIAAEAAAGRYDRGIVLARRGLAVDPAADNLEALLIRLYRMSGAHAAAAEQYGHYAAALRDDLGIEAPPIEIV